MESRTTRLRAPGTSPSTTRTALPGSCTPCQLYADAPARTETPNGPSIKEKTPMPMIDVYAATGTFASKHQLAQDLAKAVMRWEGVPTIPLFLDNTAAFIHALPLDAISNAAGDSNYVRVQV